MTPEQKMGFAKNAAAMSLDPSTKVGAAIFSGSNLLAIGHNQIPARLRHSSHQLHDRGWKYPRIIHAEHDAIMKLRHSGVHDFNLHLFCTHYPCERCAAAIAHAGINEVWTYRVSPEMQERWPGMAITTEIFKEASIFVNFL